MARPIGTLGTISTLTIGGYVFTDLTNLIELWAGATSSPNQRASFRKLNETSGYQVTALKTFKLKAIKIYNQDTGFGALTIGYSDNDVGVFSSTAFTNPVYVGGNVNFAVVVEATAGKTTENSILFDVPASKYLGYDNTNTAKMQVFAYGYEV